MPLKLTGVLQDFIKDLVLKTMDSKTSYTEQPQIKLEHVRVQVRCRTRLRLCPFWLIQMSLKCLGKFSFLRKYENVWPVDDFMRSVLKYDKQRAKGKANQEAAEREAVQNGREAAGRQTRSSANK